MTAKYRVFHFAPNPISGARYPLAAAISWGNGEPDTVVAGHVPGPECLGSMSLHRLAMRFLEDVSGVDNLSKLPDAYELVGLVDELKALPRVENPEQWLRDNVLAPQWSKSEPSDRRLARAPNRSTLGKRFFRQYQMDEIVQHDFQPKDVLGERWEIAPRVSHYAGAEGRLVLVEPLSMQRTSYMDDAKKVAQRLSVYRANRPLRSDIETVVMVLPHSGFSARQREVSERLESCVDTVVDVVDDRQRNLLFETLSQAAKAAAD